MPLDRPWPGAADDARRTRARARRQTARGRVRVRYVTAARATHGEGTVSWCGPDRSVGGILTPTSCVYAAYRLREHMRRLCHGV